MHEAEDDVAKWQQLYDGQVLIARKWRKRTSRAKKLAGALSTE